MTGDQELLRVAELIRLCAATATLIGKTRSVADRDEIDRLYGLALRAADGLETVVAQTERKPGDAKH